MGESAILKPVMIINTICIANPYKSKKPSYQDVIILIGEASIQKKALKATNNVRRRAYTNALGMYFKNKCVNFYPSFVIITEVGV
jgi:hypothetical protein